MSINTTQLGISQNTMFMEKKKQNKNGRKKQTDRPCLTLHKPHWTLQNVFNTKRANVPFCCFPSTFSKTKLWNFRLLLWVCSHSNTGTNKQVIITCGTPIQLIQIIIGQKWHELHISEMFIVKLWWRCWFLYINYR